MPNKYINRFAVIFIVVMLLLAGNPGCGNQSYPLPAFQEGPKVLDPDRLLQEYQADPVKAAALYEGQEYLFPAVSVDEAFNLRTLQTEEYQKGEMFVSHGKIRFYPKFMSDLDLIASGFLVDIVGEVRGWTYGFCSIVDCTYFVVQGGDLPHPGVY